ncbi:glutamate dehydrogenase [Enterococcus rivorum]
MSRLNRIQNEIKQLEGGRFQKLCDTYLYRKRNWENIVSLGSMEGTDKTTKGIPDTYFFDSKSNSYI